MRNLLFAVALALLAVVHSTPVNTVTQIPAKPEDDVIREAVTDGFLVEPFFLPSHTTESPKTNTTVEASRLPSPDSTEGVVFEGSAVEIGDVSTTSESTTSETTTSRSTTSESTNSETTTSETTTSETTTSRSRTSESTNSGSTPSESTNSGSTTSGSTPSESTPSESTPSESTPSESTTPGSTTSMPLPHAGSSDSTALPEDSSESSTPSGSTTSESTTSESTASGSMTSDSTTSVPLQFSTTTAGVPLAGSSDSTALPEDSSESSTTQSLHTSLSASSKAAQSSVTQDHISASQTTDPAVSIFDFLTTQGYESGSGAGETTTSTSDTETSTAPSTSKAATSRIAGPVLRSGKSISVAAEPGTISASVGNRTPSWIIIVGFIVGIAALVMLFVAIATRDKWNGPTEAPQLEDKVNASNQQREIEMETFLHKDRPMENGKAAEYTVIPLEELPENYSSH